MPSSMHPTIAHLVETARPYLEQYGYAGLFVANFVEGFGIPLPGQTLLVGGALLAGASGFDIRLVIGTAFAAALLGNCVGYLIGRTGGHALLVRLRIAPARLARVEAFFARRGMIVVVIARFLDGLRQTAPLVAGTLKMPWWQFFVASAIGAAAWVSVWGAAAYLVGEHFDALFARLDRLAHHGWWLTGLALVALLLWLVRRKRAR